MSTVVTGFNGNSNTLLLKGAPERVIEKCVTYKLANGSVQNLSKD
jgi:magnesium-transporting ATPase (P-type)